MNILYSFNKSGFEADYWTREIAAASAGPYSFVPFNHGDYLDPNRSMRAQLLDNLYYQRDADLLRLYSVFEETLQARSIDAVIVDNCFPYHPDYLRKLSVYRVLRTSDGPMTAYDRDFAYVHAYDHVLFHSPAYSADMGMADKLRYCGATTVDFWPSQAARYWYFNCRQHTLCPRANPIFGVVKQSTSPITSLAKAVLPNISGIVKLCKAVTECVTLRHNRLKLRSCSGSKR